MTESQPVLGPKGIATCLGVPLALFPAELLSYLCEFVLSSKIMLLWLSGDRRLRQNLVYIVSLSLVDLSAGSTSRWPQMIAQFPRLKSLRLRRYAPVLGRKSFIPQLNSLHGLTSLDLNIDQSEMHKWYQSFKKTPFDQCFPNLASL